MVNEGTIKKGRRSAPFGRFAVGRAGLAGVLLTEFVDAAAGVDDLLLARIERMAVRADFDLQVVTEGRARVEGVPAAAGHRDLFVLGVDSVFHGYRRRCAAWAKKARSVATQVGPRKKKSSAKPFGRVPRSEPGDPPAVIHKSCG